LPFSSNPKNTISQLFPTFKTTKLLPSKAANPTDLGIRRGTMHRVKGLQFEYVVFHYKPTSQGELTNAERKELCG
jgi:hypothetical protein